jgi:single-strand DNA-binding protein
MNNVNLIGRLSKDVDLRYTPNGVEAATFNLAVDRSYTDQQGKRGTDFLSIVAWRKLAETVANYCVKGSSVGFTGRIETRSWDGQDGKKRYATEFIATEIKFLSSPKNNGANGQQDQGSSKNQSNANPFGKPQQSSVPFAGGQTIDINDDDLPF